MSSLPDHASPLYEKVKDHVLDLISSGKWSTDRRLPSENELVASLGVSRMTVNRALRELSDAGHLVRIQGVGTFAAPPKPQSDLIEINNIVAEIKARGHQHRSNVLKLEEVMATPELTVAFEFERRRRVYHSLVVHFENDQAVQLEERFVNPALVPDYDKQDFSQSATYDYLIRKTPLTEVEHIITAVPASPDVAAYLGITIGESCLVLHRRTWTGATVATVNRLTYVGNRYALGSRHKIARSDS